MANLTGISTEILSLKEVSQITGYHSDYLSFLIRKNKLRGVKVGKSWAVDRKEVDRLVREKSKPKKRIINILSVLFLSITILIIAFFLVLFFPKKDEINISGDFSGGTDSAIVKKEQIQITEVTTYVVDGEGEEVSSFSDLPNN